MISSIIYTDTKAYLDKVVDQALLDLLKSDYPKVYDHVQQLIANFEETIQQIDHSNFWQLMPEILGYDSRFVLLNSLQFVGRQIFDGNRGYSDDRTRLSEFE